jgi:hypothetical protein
VAVADGVSDGDVDGVTVAETVDTAETDVDEEAVGVLLAVPQRDSVWDGVAEIVGVPVDDDEALSLPVLDAEVVVDPVGVPVLDGVGVRVEDGVAALVPVEEKETEGVCVEETDSVDVPLADANWERVVVGVGESVRVSVHVGLEVLESETVVVGLRLGVSELEGVAVPVGVAEFDAVLVVEGVREFEGVTEALAPTVTDGVGAPERDDERLSVDDDVADGVCVPDPVPESVGVTLDDGIDTVPDADVVEECERLAPSVSEGVSD